jgi:hypothetical protein
MTTTVLLSWPQGTFHAPFAFSLVTRENPMAMEETTGFLIGSDKVQGTVVYGANDEKIGSIERIMIEKINGQVSYAVLSFGGFLGIGNEYYPLPWNSLMYDTGLGGYRIDVTADQLKSAPKYKTDSSWNWSDPARSKEIDDYW